jgi:hypothetical protein
MNIFSDGAVLWQHADKKRKTAKTLLSNIASSFTQALEMLNYVLP